ncbi:MAG: hypothetical protein JRI25_13175, partial [Deltaproteobacteria bacterium]|nr:hypothetical protein [Deltaproteobacteria bacterium]
MTANPRASYRRDARTRRAAPPLRLFIALLALLLAAIAGCTGDPALRADGEACSTGDDCVSSFCKDATCCSNPCDTPCYRCGTGTCTEITGEDDAPECTGSETCDAGGACKLKEGESCTLAGECVSLACPDGTCCDLRCEDPCFECTTGTCVPVTGADDVPQCAGDQTCDPSGHCMLKNGEVCESADQCASGHCRDDRCCPEACDGPCEECSGGSCATVTGTDD